MTYDQALLIGGLVMLLAAYTYYRHRAYRQVLGAACERPIWVVEVRTPGDANDATLCELFESEAMALRWISREDPEDWDGGYFALYSQPLNTGQHEELDFTFSTPPSYYWPGTSQALDEQPDKPLEGFTIGEPDVRVAYGTSKEPTT